MFASILLGSDALAVVSTATALVVGTAVHLVLSSAFGLVYGVLNARPWVSAPVRWGKQLATGVLFGVALWFVNFQILGRLLYPWFLNAPQLLQAALHAFFFGLPLAGMFAAAQGRTPRTGPPFTQA